MLKQISYCLLVLVMYLPLSEARNGWAADEKQTLDIHVEGEGIAIVHARLELPVPPEEVLTVLTDYLNWPDLFPYDVRVQVEKISDGSVLTEMTIPNKIFSWTTHLKIKSRVTQPNRLEMNLVEGDFHQYEQVWQLTPVLDGSYTRAELTLMLQPKGWIMQLVPDFLYQWVLRGDLEAHFEKFRKQLRLRHETRIKEAS